MTKETERRDQEERCKAIKSWSYADRIAKMAERITGNTCAVIYTHDGYRVSLFDPALKEFIV